MDLDERITEQLNPDSVDIDSKSIPEILRIINANDRQVADAVARALPSIAEAVAVIVRRLEGGGRLFYVGAGTSGRLGIVDAAECPPTFGVSPELVQGVIAGGNRAVFRAREGCEDNERMGGRDLLRRGLCERDVVVGLSSSGRTPYVRGALRKARELGVSTIALICNESGSVCDYADVAISVVPGPEVITGSTRMKAGTAQKMVLNMLSTATMIRLGRVTGNMMTDMKVSCSKLRERARRMVMRMARVDADTADRALEEAQGDVRAAIELAGTHIG